MAQSSEAGAGVALQVGGVSKGDLPCSVAIMAGVKEYLILVHWLSMNSRQVEGGKRCLRIERCVWVFFLVVQEVCRRHSPNHGAKAEAIRTYRIFLIVCTLAGWPALSHL